MRLRGLLLSFLTLVACLTWHRPVHAEPLWAKLMPGQRVEADINADYTLKDSNGPWIIVATTFSGEGAEQQADELVLELRRRYKLEAYKHSKTFDFTGTVQGRGVDRHGDPNRMRYSREMELHEIAVLVGNYPSYDDSTAQAHLEKIKYLTPDTLDPEKRGKTSQTLAMLRIMQRAMAPDGDARHNKGPMAKAFITRNPLLPKEYFAQQGLDDFVIGMNEPAKYSLLKCPGKYTLKVATFTGRVIIDQKEVQALESGKKSMKSDLEEAAIKAEDLTFALRAKGFEAYSFHDRTSSIVTVGSFNSLGTQQTDGHIELFPQIYKLMEIFAADPVPGTGGGFTVKKMRIGDRDISFDISPELVHAPKASATSSFTQRMGAR